MVKTQQLEGTSVQGGVTWPDTMSGLSDPGVRGQGTSWPCMMYMVRGNRGGAETDGRAEDPFEAAACGASASALQLVLLPLCLHRKPAVDARSGSTEWKPFPWRHFEETILVQSFPRAETSSIHVHLNYDQICPPCNGGHQNGSIRERKKKRKGRRERGRSLHKVSWICV